MSLSEFLDFVQIAAIVIVGFILHRRLVSSEIRDLITRAEKIASQTKTPLDDAVVDIGKRLVETILPIVDQTEHDYLVNVNVYNDSIHMSIQPDHSLEVSSDDDVNIVG